jgi:hypothetical protein
MYTSAGIIALCSGLAGQKVMAKYEQPSYEVLQKNGDIELRQYQPRIIASVEVPASDKDAANQAFRILAGYIFGKNKGQQKVAMTVPVTEEVKAEKIAMTIPVTEEKIGQSMRMSFNMPTKYTLDSLPKPNDERIKFSTLPPARFVTIRFSGFASAAAFDKHTKILKSYMSEHQLKESGQPMKAFYDAPWTLPFFRRNEVLIAVDG